MEGIGSLNAGWNTYDYPVLPRSVDPRNYGSSTCQGLPPFQTAADLEIGKGVTKHETKEV